MKIWRGMVFSDSLRGHEDEIIEKLKNSQFPGGIVVLYIPEDRSHPLNICAAPLLFQKYFREADLLIVGAAADREEGAELAGRLLLSTKSTIGNFNLSSCISEEDLL